MYRGDRERVMTIPAPAQDLNLLFVMSSTANKEAIKTGVEKRGYPVTIVSSKQEALDLLKQTHYHVVVIDCGVPEIEGYTLGLAIRDLDKAQQKYHVVIGLDEGPKSTENRRWQHANMTDYCPKPVSIKQIIDLVEKYKNEASDTYV